MTTPAIDEHVLVYSTDRTYNQRLLRMYATPDSMQTRLHRARPNDHGLALCSSRIVLNSEDAMPVGTVRPPDLCRRCFPTRPGGELVTAMPVCPDTADGIHDWRTRDDTHYKCVACGGSEKRR